ncbi:MAG: hypothetical protein SPI15_03675 [Candidatus Faecousia sp.]|nr:hypothetical protein [Clostridiales bacterium]MDY6179929.1 hypothetical protein [Candidatus Faecousia sp.]
MFCPNCGRDCGVSRVCPVCGYVSGGEDSGSAEGETDVLGDILPLLEEHEGENRPLTGKGSGIIPTARLVCPNCGRQYEARIRGTAGKKRRLAPTEYREYPQEREKDDILEDVRPLLRQREENSRTVQEEIRRRQSPAPILICPHCGTQTVLGETDAAHKQELASVWEGRSGSSAVLHSLLRPWEENNLTVEEEISRRKPPEASDVICPQCGSARCQRSYMFPGLIWVLNGKLPSKLIALALQMYNGWRYGNYICTCFNCGHQWREK